jgi:hypothetical protein
MNDGILIGSNYDKRYFNRKMINRRCRKRKFIKNKELI